MLGNLGYTALLLAVLIFVHEFGHFIVAKLCGVKVLKFSIGFGPRILGFRRGETEYALSWIPLGGYVKMAGEQTHDDLTPEEAARGFLAQPPWKRGLIVAAGPAFNLIFPILAYFFVFVGARDVLSNRIGSVEPGLPAAAAGLQPGDRVVEIDGAPVKTFEDLREALQPKHGQEIALVIEREGERRPVTLTPARTVESNPIETVQRGMIGISPIARPPLIAAPEGSAAAAAGLKTFDRVLAVNGKPVADEVAFFQAMEAAEGEQVGLKVQRNRSLEVGASGVEVPQILEVQAPRIADARGYEALGGESVQAYVASVAPGSVAEKVGIRPGDELLTLDGKPLPSFNILALALREQEDKPFTLTWRQGTEEKSATLSQVQVTQTDDMGNKSENWELGVRPRIVTASEVATPEMVTLNLGVGEAMSRSLKVVPEIISKTAIVIGYLFTGRVPMDSVGGPIMVYQLASRSAEAGLDSYLNLMAVISVNLGLMNLLPIPILDGFALLSAIWEGIRRRPIPIRAREVANMVGLVMLILLMLLSFRNDITRLVTG